MGGLGENEMRGREENGLKWRDERVRERRGKEYCVRQGEVG